MMMAVMKIALTLLKWVWQVIQIQWIHSKFTLPCTVPYCTDLVLLQIEKLLALVCGTVTL